ncbi:hypothetical protein HIM_01463 [Hirsutella minnesotensis 3608]|nr:hypothetical protein HIM_01463 [Hirsutella minnesotensis 3608]
MPSGAPSMPSTTAGDGAPPSQSSPAAPAARTREYSPLMRQVRQFGLFMAGASFMAASVAVSRRSVIRRRLEAMPAFHTSNRHAPGVDAADRVSMATQALGLATLNVVSFGVLLTGGIAWGFDLCSVAELRHRTQAALRRPGNMDPEAEKEMEDMMKSLLEKLGMDASLPEKGEEPAAGAGEQSKR